jgi:hypothetical protein
MWYVCQDEAGQEQAKRQDYLVKGTKEETTNGPVIAKRCINNRCLYSSSFPISEKPYAPAPEPVAEKISLQSEPVVVKKPKTPVWLANLAFSLTSWRKLRGVTYQAIRPEIINCQQFRST